MPRGPSSFRAALCAGQHGHLLEEGRAALLYPPVSLQTIHLQTTTPGADFREAKFSPVPFRRGLGEAGRFGSLPTARLAQRGDPDAAQVSARHRLWSGARAEGNASAWDCRWPHAGLYPKLPLHLRQGLTCPLRGLTHPAPTALCPPASQGSEPPGGAVRPQGSP